MIERVAPADGVASAATRGAVTEPPPGARELFGVGFEQAKQFAAVLAAEGVRRGILGPAEASRLWERHLLNCVVISGLVPPAARLLDVGSGGGLPGIPVALARPDVQVTLLDAGERRVTFLTEVIAVLGCTQLQVLRGRVEDYRGRPFDIVTARAVAPLTQLASWCASAVRPGGSLVAIRGQRAAEELAASASALAALGFVDAEVVTCGAGVLAVLTLVVKAVKRGDLP